MIAISLNKSISDLPNIVSNTLRNFEETLIVSEQGTDVLISQEDLENMRETIKILRDKETMKSINDVHLAKKKGVKLKSVTIEEAFYDLQSSDFGKSK